MKIAAIGGGSTYTPELAQGLIEHSDKLGLGQWWLMDTDPERLQVVGGFVERMVTAQGSPFNLHLTTDRREALTGADFVITQIRVGGMAARREDEYLGRRWGLVGQETTGIGGMAKALRSVPVIVSIARDMEELCPQAWLINFTNPAGLILEALQKEVPKTRSIGLCNGPIGYQMLFAKELGVEDPFDIHLDYLGLNHLAWIRGARVGGEDVWDRLSGKDDPAQAGNPMALLGVICNYYLDYYYNTQNILREQAKNQPSRAEEVMKVEERLLAHYADPAVKTMPPDLMERGGAYYSTAAVRLMEAIMLDLGQEQIVNTRQGRAVAGLPPEWVMELPCRIGRDRIEPLPAEPLPLFADGLLRTVKAYELLTIRAACTGDRQAALAALVAHPLGPDTNQALAVLEDMLSINRDYLANFF